MGIIQFIESVCVQTAVYWGSPAADGFGKKDFADPVEIAVRWTDVEELHIKRGQGVPGQEHISNAEVLLTTEVERGGYLMLGTLDDIPSDNPNPVAIEGAYEIEKVTKTPLFRSTDQFVRKAYV